MRWYERPHDGAHATDVTANALDGSPSLLDVEVVLVASAALGEGLRLSTVVGRCDGDIWMIFGWGGKLTRGSWDSVR